MFYHGTSIEMLRSIIRTGYMSPAPKQQVWPDYSGQHIYFFPEYKIIYAKEAAAEQAAFALWSFHHKQRAIIEIDPSLLNSKYISADPNDDDAVRYSEPIPIEHISKVYVESDESDEWTRKCLEFVAIFKFDHKFHMYDSGFFKADVEKRAAMMQSSGVHSLDLVAKEIWSSGSKLLDRHEDLSDELKDMDRFQEFSIAEIAG